MDFWGQFGSTLLALVVWSFLMEGFRYAAILWYDRRQDKKVAVLRSKLSSGDLGQIQAGLESMGIDPSYLTTTETELPTTKENSGSDVGHYR